MTVLETIAVVLGIACVWLTVRQHIACWPTGLAMVLLYIVIFYRAKLYSDMLLQVVYVGLQIYGWYAWLYGGPDRTTLRVTRLTPRAAWVCAFLCVGGTLLLGRTMDRYTDASLPYVDAFCTSASLVAQWLLGRKILESWIVWSVVDVISIGMYLAKDLHLTAGLYALFLFLAALGFVQWRRATFAPATA